MNFLYIWTVHRMMMLDMLRKDDAQISTAVAQLSTAAILALTGDVDAQSVWTDESLNDWISSGASLMSPEECRSIDFAILWFLGKARRMAALNRAVAS